MNKKFIIKNCSNRFGKIRNLIDDYKQRPELAIKQLEDCSYECEAGFLENNVAFIALKELVNEKTIGGNING